MVEGKQRSVSSKLTLIGGGIFVAGLAVVAFLYFSTRSTLTNRIQALQQAGMPTSGSELNDFYMVPSEVPDTTQFWVAACNAVQARGFNEATKGLPVLGVADAIPPVGEEWPLQAKSVTAVETTLAKELAIVRKAVAMGGLARFPIDFRQGVKTSLNNTQQMRSVARLLQLDAHVAARQGDSQRVIDDIRGVLTTSEALAVEPTLISQLIRLAIHNMAIITAQELIPHCKCSDQQLLGLQQHLMHADLRDGLRRGFMGERAIGIELVGGFAPGPFRAENQLIAMDFYEEAIERAAAPGVDIKKWQEGQKQRIQALTQGTLSKFRFRGVLMALPATAQAATAFVRSEASRRCLLLALAAQRQRLRDGKYPTSLPDETLMGAESSVTEDPFTGKPMLTKSDKATLTYYSVGPDGMDDGGDVDAQDHNPSDIGFCVPKLADDESAPAGSAVVK